MTVGKHTRNCFIKNNVDVSEYQCEGKPLAQCKGDDKENVDPDRVNSKRTRILNVTQEMMKATDDLARDTLTLDASKVWEKTKAEMDEKCPEGWTGIKKEAVVQ
jgi:hypothetical protein